MPLLDHTGAAKPSTLDGGIDSAVTTIVGTDLTGWPTGGANGPFYATIDRGTSAEEAVLVGSRSGNSLNSVTRGADGTTAASHSNGATIEHSFSAVEAEDANSHVFDTTQDHHSQYLNTTRHAAVTHTAAMLGTDSVGSDELAPNAVTATELSANAVTTAKILDANVTTAKIADLNVTTGKLADNAVTNAKIADTAIDDENFFGPNLSPIIVSATNPGAVGARRLWYNTTKPCLNIRNAADTGWEVMIDMSTGTDYTPVLSNITLGTGGINDARYHRVGRMIVANGYIQLGTSGANVTGDIEVSLPVAAANLSADYSGAFYAHAASRAGDASSLGAFAAVGLISISDAHPTFDVNIMQFFATAGAIGWDGTTPFNWDINDNFSWFCEYPAASLEDANYV